MEIVQERLDREYQVEIITTLPNVLYEILTKDGELNRCGQSLLIATCH